MQGRVHGQQRRHVHGVRDGHVQGLAGAWCMHLMSCQLRVACRFVRPLSVDLLRDLCLCNANAKEEDMQKSSIRDSRMLPRLRVVCRSLSCVALEVLAILD